MGSRSKSLGKAIIRAIASDDENKRTGILPRLLAFFRILTITLARFKPELFQKLRGETWQIDEESYRRSFTGDGLKSAGDLGYSGSV